MHISQYRLSLTQNQSNNHEKADSSVITVTRPRVYSKPTREELKELNNYLTQRSAEDLRALFILAATQSNETAHVLLRLLNSHSLLQPVQFPTTNLHLPFSQHVHDGLLTPVDSGEDSEMSGTETTAPSFHQHYPSTTQPLTEASGSSMSTQVHAPVHLKAPSPAQERRLKRKTLADWDDGSRFSGSNSDKGGNATIPPFQHSPSMKRRRALLSLAKDPHHILSTCVNCGREYAPSKPDGLYGCMYHPGILASVETEYLDDGARKVIKTGTWDCCQGSYSSPGCLVTQHRDVNVQGYRKAQSLNYTGSQNGVSGDQNTAMAMGARSSFAEAVSARLLVR